MWVSQGNLLASILFLIYINPLLPLRIDAILICYAGDTVTIFSGSSRVERSEKLAKYVSDLMMN